MKCPKCKHTFSPESIELLESGNEKTKKTLIDWKSDYELGITVIDRQHQEILKTLNKVYLSHKTGHRPKNFLKEIFDELDAYIKQHFSTEEKLFMSSQYDRKRTHKDQHRLFEKQVAELKQAYSEQIINPSAIIGFIYGWFSNHILGEDRTYIPFVKNVSEKK